MPDSTPQTDPILPEPSPFAGFPPVIGEWKLEKAAAALREVEAPIKAKQLEESAAKAAAESQGVRDWFDWLLGTPAWKHTSHLVGFLEPMQDGVTGPLDIKDAGTIDLDTTLIGKQITISLMSMRAWDYPGSGTHNILFTFSARNQTTSGPEPVAFNLTAPVREGESAGVINYLIFDGLTVGEKGVAFEGQTVNVSNSGDEAMMSGIDSSVFKDGLKLLATAQPAIKPFTELGMALAKAIAGRNRNQRVHWFKIGLNFSRLPGAVRLREGAYLIAQVPPPPTGKPGLKWDDWVYLFDQRTIARKEDHSSQLPVNFVMIGVERTPPTSPTPAAG